MSDNTPEPLSAEERVEWADRALTDRYPAAGTMNRWWGAFQATEAERDLAMKHADAAEDLAETLREEVARLRDLLRKAWGDEIADAVREETTDV